MNVYKTVDQFSRVSGEKIGTQRVIDHVICDFTGERLDQYQNPNYYQVDYNSNDPNFGDNDGERWLYKYQEIIKSPDEDDEDYDDDDEMSESRVDPYALFGSSPYCFIQDDYTSADAFADLLKAAKKAKLEIYSLDYLLRWSRGKMVEKVVKEGRYKLTDFLPSFD